MSFSNPAPDSFIVPADSIAYWNSAPATVTGMLGGYPQVSRADLQGSRTFLARLRRSSLPNSSSTSPNSSERSSSEPLPRLGRVVEVGAGIGRITKGFLSHVASEIDVVEPVKKFTDELQSEKTVQEIEEHGARLSRIFNVGLEDWDPFSSPSTTLVENTKTSTEQQHTKPYDLVWAQWCVGHLPDSALVKFLRETVPQILTPTTGLLVIKENLSTHKNGEDEFDMEDSQVTRSEQKFRTLIKQAGLDLVKFDIQKGFAKSLGLRPVAMFGVRVPERNRGKKRESQERDDAGRIRKKNGITEAIKKPWEEKVTESQKEL